MVETSWFQYRQTWRASVFSAFLGPLLYLGAIGFGLGSLVDSDAATLGSSGGEAVSYVSFLAPGLIAATALQVGAGEAIFGTVAATKWRRTWFTAVGTPLMPADMAVGHLLWTGVRGGLAAVVYALVTAALGILSPWRALAAVGPAVLGGLGLAALIMAGMVLSEDEGGMNAAQRFIVVPMFLFSGVFFPISQLPGWMQPVAQATPLWHGVELARLAALGQAPAWGVGGHLLAMVGFIVVGVALCLRNFPKRLLS